MASLPGLFGVCSTLAGYASIAADDRLTRWLMAVRFLDETASSPAEARMGTVRSSVIVLLGLFLIALQIAMWLFPATREYFVSIPTAVVTNFEGDFFLTLGVLVGSILAGMVGWVLHRVALVVQTAAIGAAMVAVSGAPPAAIRALVAADLRALLALVDVASVSFLAVFVVGVLVQTGATLTVAGE